MCVCGGGGVCLFFDEVEDPTQTRAASELSWRFRAIKISLSPSLSPLVVFFPCHSKAVPVLQLNLCSFVGFALCHFISSSSLLLSVRGNAALSDYGFSQVSSQ